MTAEQHRQEADELYSEAVSMLRWAREKYHDAPFSASAHLNMAHGYCWEARRHLRALRRLEAEARQAHAPPHRGQIGQ